MDRANDWVVGPMFRRGWAAIAVRGLIGVAFGLVALGWPGPTVAVLLAVLGIYFIFDGILALIATFSAARDGRSWWPYLLQGLLSMVVGVLGFARPAAFALGVLVLVAVRSWTTGVVEIAAAVWLRRETGRSEWLLGLAGVLSIVFGALLVMQPAAGALTLIWLIAIYSIAFGVAMMATALRMRSVERHILTPQHS